MGPLGTPARQLFPLEIQIFLTIHYGRAGEEEEGGEGGRERERESEGRERKGGRERER